MSRDHKLVTARWVKSLGIRFYRLRDWPWDDKSYLHFKVSQPGVQIEGRMCRTNNHDLRMQHGDGVFYPRRCRQIDFLRFLVLAGVTPSAMSEQQAAEVKP
jgi:hypothetical protein